MTQTLYKGIRCCINYDGNLVRFCGLACMYNPSANSFALIMNFLATFLFIIPGST